MKRVAIGIVMLIIAFELAQEFVGAFLQDTLGTIGILLMTMFFFVVGISLIGVMSFTGILRRVGL